MNEDLYFVNSRKALTFEEAIASAQSLASERYYYDEEGERAVYITKAVAKILVPRPEPLPVINLT